MQIFERIFKLKQNKTTVKQEAIAGLSTFLAMVYIVTVNPAILSEIGMDYSAVFVATIISATFACLLMGLYANLPLALATGMGTNAFFAFGIVVGENIPWQEALAGVFFSGCLFLILSLLNIRSYIFGSFPKNLVKGLSAGIGLFIMFIGLRNAGIIEGNEITLLKAGDISNPSVYLTMIGVMMILFLEYFKIIGSVLISILFITIVSILIGIIDLSGISQTNNSLDFNNFFALDFNNIWTTRFLIIVFTFLIIDIFDTSVTFVGLTKENGLKLPNNQEGKIKTKKGFIVDSLATIFGSIAGTSTVTTYIENIVGIKQGGKTGLTSIVVGILFLVTLTLLPIIKIIPDFATSPALIFVGIMMFSSIKNIEWHDLTESAPVFLTMIGMLTTTSLMIGMAWGFLSYSLLKIITKRWHELSLPVIIVSLLYTYQLIFIN